MDKTEHSPHNQMPPGFALAPIHSGDERIPLRICVLLRAQPDPVGGSFVLLRELPGARVYLGAVCDAAARIQEWVEIWVQTLELRDLAFSSHQEQLANFSFDQRWRAENDLAQANLPDSIILTGMENKNPNPILIMQPGEAPVAPIEPTTWRLCKDDAELEKHGLPPYSTSPYRYLEDLSSAGPKTFIAATTDAPSNSHVQGLDRLKAGQQVLMPTPD
jgi:hypothetical protein